MRLHVHTSEASYDLAHCLHDSPRSGRSTVYACGERRKRLLFWKAREPGINQLKLRLLQSLIHKPDHEEWPRRSVSLFQPDESILLGKYRPSNDWPILSSMIANKPISFVALRGNPPPPPLPPPVLPVHDHFFTLGHVMMLQVTNNDHKMFGSSFCKKKMKKVKHSTREWCTGILS